MAETGPEQSEPSRHDYMAKFSSAVNRGLARTYPNDVAGRESQERALAEDFDALKSRVSTVLTIIGGDEGVEALESFLNANMPGDTKKSWYHVSIAPKSQPLAAQPEISQKP